MVITVACMYYFSGKWLYDINIVHIFGNIMVNLNLGTGTGMARILGIKTDSG
jgi:hypothetical protein